MSNFFMFLFLLSILAFILGMIKPYVVIRWGPEEKKTRSKVAIICLCATLVFFILIGVTLPPKPKNVEIPVQQQQTKKELPIQQITEDIKQPTELTLEEKFQAELQEYVHNNSFLKQTDWYSHLKECTGYIKGNNTIVIRIDTELYPKNSNKEKANTIARYFSTFPPDKYKEAGIKQIAVYVYASNKQKLAEFITWL